MTLRDQLAELRQVVSQAMRSPGTAMIRLPSIINKLLDLLGELIERVEGIGRGK